jgi:hypothetical protein
VIERVNLSSSLLIRVDAMRRQTIHRIYTEEKNKNAIVQLVGTQFESFTLQPTLGYYRGSAEKSIVIEIVGASASKIKLLAERIRKMNGQQSVLILRLEGHSEIRRR